jgi:hypothetical protein
MPASPNRCSDGVGLIRGDTLHADLTHRFAQLGGIDCPSVELQAVCSGLLAEVLRQPWFGAHMQVGATQIFGFG